MKFLELYRDKSSNSLILKVLLGELEFRNLKGFTDHICMFSTQTINQPSRITKTGARHSCAKWFLLPVKLRAQFLTEEYDYKNAKAGFVKYKDCVFFVYRINKKSAIPPSSGKLDN